LKFENYLNLDAGTINPMNTEIHFFVKTVRKEIWISALTKKYLNADMGKENFITMARIYQTVIDRERRV